VLTVDDRPHLERSATRVLVVAVALVSASTLIGAAAGLAVAVLLVGRSRGLT
jgi:hypothetical protein